MPAISTGAVLEQKHTHLDENADLNLYQFIFPILLLALLRV